MPVTIGSSTKLGLDLWDSLPATVAIELILFAVGVGLYARFTEARDLDRHRQVRVLPARR